MDTEYVEKVGSVAARATKENPQKWVVKKHGSQVDEVHMTRSLGLSPQTRKLIKLGGAHLNEL